MESFVIRDIDFTSLVHLALDAEDRSQDPPEQIHASDSADVDQPPASTNRGPDRVVLISHGWSEEDGPNYPLIRTLEASARRQGWSILHVYAHA